jgi:riboflavin kinase/FMN adenylyltransferase
MSVEPALTPVSIDRVPTEFKGAVVAVGNFDGVHRGHAALLAGARAEAKRLGAPSLVLTFEPHPRSFFRPESPVFRLTPAPAKARLLTALGMDGMVIAPFDRAFASMTADDFVDRILRERLDIRGAVVGFDFQFGKGRAGNAAVLASAGERFGFPVTIVDAVSEPGATPFASRAIRAALVDGDVSTANRLLGYQWFVAGEVIHGAKRGREIGFPTANMAVGGNCALRHGIYAVRVEEPDGTIRNGVASYGRRPMFDNGEPLLETYLLDFAGDLYGRRLAVSFVEWLRPELKFNALDDLLVAMRDDVSRARRALAVAGPGTELDRALAGIAP